MWELINKLTLSKGLQITLIIFANLVAPYWFYYHFFPPMIEGDNIFKHVIFCLALGIPLTLAGFVLALMQLTDEQKKIPAKQRQENWKNLSDEERQKTTFSFISYGSLFVAMFLYFPCIFKYYNPAIKKDSAILLISVFFIGFFVFYMVDLIRVEFICSRKEKRLKAEAKKLNHT